MLRLGPLPIGLFLTSAALLAGPSRADDAKGVAHRILDDALPPAEREALVRDHPELSVDLVAAMVADLPRDPVEEYRRIPWIWRVAIAAGKRNDADELRRLIDLATPSADGRLDDWRAVVLGGGVINGLTLSGVWPAERIDGLLEGHADLAARWRRSIDLASAMADDPHIKTGTRYDALRMLGVEPWDRRGAQLFRYLLKGVHPELQQGAVCALGDVGDPAVPQALLSGLPHYSEGNRDFALDALLRDPERVPSLLDALAAGLLTRDSLGDSRVKALTGHADPKIQERAGELLK